ncbi:MAG: C39 family peptidase [archaeon]
MILKVPFYKNDGDGNQCMQVSMKSILKYFLDKDFSLEELDNLTGRKENLWTYTTQIVSVLYCLGLDLKFYSKEELEPFLEGESFIRKHFGKDAEKILKFTDVPVVVKSTKNLLNYNLFEKKILSLDEIEKHILEGHVLLVLVDYNKISRKEGNYQGHSVVITGFDDDYIYFHESGPSNPEPNKKVSKKIFEEAMNANGTDNDCVVVFGKRK